MPQKKENLPVKVDVDLQNGGTITYANEVIATIAGVAANEVDGIAGMCVSGGFSEILGRNRNITRGVKVEVGSQEAAVDLYIIVEYGKPIQKVAGEVQENVRKALESLTGLHVVRVDVHVQGVSFEKEKKAAQNSIEAAKKPVLIAAKKPEEAPAPKAEEAPAPAVEETVEEIAQTAEEAIEAAPTAEAAEQAAQEIEEAAAEFNEEVLEEEGKLDAAVEEVKAEAEQAQPEEEAAGREIRTIKPKRPAGRRRS
jgi:uncharacterized alkaline shock family protein YloU